MITRKTFLMLAITAILAGLDALDFRETATTGPELPSLPKVAVEEVRKITIGDQINMLTLERASKDDPWRIVAPLQYPADAQLVKSYVKDLAAGVPMDTQVDEGNLEDYGVDDQHALRAELYTSDEAPALAVMVGKTAGSESSFVRLPGSDIVYRAAVGARSRFERAAGDWRDRTIFELPREDVQSIVLERGAEKLSFTRGPSPGKDPHGDAIPGTWSLAGAPFPIDNDSVELIAHALTRLRAGEFHNPAYDAGFGTPAAVATFTMRDGASHRVVVGSKADERAAWLRVDDRPDVFRVGAKIREVMTVPVSALRDRTLAKFDRLAIDSMAWTEGSLTVGVQWDATAVRWRVTQPANMDVDQKAIASSAAQLAQLRAVAIASDATFSPSGTVVKLKTKDGVAWQMDLGAPESDGKLVRAKVTGHADIYFVDARQVADIRGGFGR